MSFLDRLKREAEQQRQQAEALSRERDEREMRYRGQIEPQMKALVAYLEGLAATLLEVKPPISIAMSVQGYGDLVTVPFWDYKVEHERRHRSFAVTMTWSMKIDSERTPLVRAEGVTRVKALISIFRQYHLGGIKEEKRTPQGDLSCASFQARGYIKSRMEAQISADDPVLRLMFENASWLGSSRRQVPWEQINDSLFDRIARFIVREDDSLFTEELPDALRQRLRKEPEPVATIPELPSAPAREVAPPIPLPAASAAPESIPAPIDTFATDTSGGFGQGMLAAPAPMTEGEVIEIDESKLGLSDFQPSDELPGAFSIGTVSRTPPAAATPASNTPPANAPSPMARGDFIAFDESKLGNLDAYAESPMQSTPVLRSPAPITTPQTSIQAPVSTAAAGSAAVDDRRAPTAAGFQVGSPPPAASTTAVNPHAAAAAHAAAMAQRAAAARAAAAPVAPPAVAPAAVAPAAVAPIASPSVAAADPGDALDPAKEREAALFRLRMRAMMARLRTDEQDEPKV